MTARVPQPIPSFPVAGSAWRMGPSYGAPASIALVLNTEYATPIQLWKAVAVTKIGLSVVAAGNATSVIRLGLRADAGCVPGAVIADAGTIDGTSATFQELTIAQNIGPGIVWVSATWQVGAVGSGTINGLTGVSPLIMDMSPGSPGSGHRTAYNQTGVTGALGAFGTPANVGFGPRVTLKVT